MHFLLFLSVFSRVPFSPHVFGLFARSFLPLLSVTVQTALASRTFFGFGLQKLDLFGLFVGPKTPVFVSSFSGVRFHCLWECVM